MFASPVEAGQRPHRRISRRSLLGALAVPFVPPARADAPRVASLDYAMAQHLIVLGVPPVAVSDARDWNRWVAEPPLPESTVDIGTSVAPNLELLAALKPDLVLTSDYVSMNENKLRRIAPVKRFSLYAEGGSPLPKATESMPRLGALLGREAQARAYLDDTEAFFAACAARARPFRDRPVLILSFFDPRHVRIYARPGLYQDVLDRLGLDNAWKEGGSYWGFATVGIERLAAVGDAFVLVDHLPPDVQAVLESSPLWRALPIRGNAASIPVLPPVLPFGGVPAARRLAALLVDALEGRPSRA